jgi:hypothetical protein
MWDGSSAPATDSYFAGAELRDAAAGSLGSWTRGTRAAPLLTSSDAWVFEQHLFSGYGAAPGAIVLQVGGKDGEYWAGHFGAKFDGGRVVVQGVACPSCEDGVRNQAETGIDCGGLCAVCP